MKNSKIIICLILLSLMACDKNREIGISGFGYYNDKIIIYHNNDLIFESIITKSTTSNNLDPNSIFTIYEKSLKVASSEVKFRIKIDSSNISVLDTFLVVPSKFKQPFIIFANPNDQKKFKRTISLIDDNNFPQDKSI